MFSRPQYNQATTTALGRKGALALISRIAPGVATLLVNIAIGRLGGSALLGLTQTITSGASIAALAYPAGGAASRYVSSLGAQREVSAASALASYLAIRVALISLFAAAVVTTAVLIGDHGSLVVAVLSGSMVLAVSGRAFVEGLHFGGGEGERLARWSLSIAILSSAATVVLLLIGVRDAWVIAPLIVLNITFVLVSWPRRARSKIDGRLSREIRGFIALSVVGMLASTGFAQSAVLIAGLSEGLSFVGEYSAAMTMTTPLGVVASALGAVLFPALAAAHGTGDFAIVQQRLKQVTAVLVTVMVGAFIPLALLSSPLTRILWGPDFARTWWILLFVLPAIVLSAIAVPSVSAVTASSNRGMATSAVSSVIGAVLGACVWLILIPSGNEVAVPLGFATGTTVIAVIPLAVAWRRFQMRWLGEAVIVVLTLVATLAAAVWGQDLLTRSPWYSIAAITVVTALWFGLRHRSLATVGRQLRRSARG